MALPPIKKEPAIETTITLDKGELDLVSQALGYFMDQEDIFSFVTDEQAQAIDRLRRRFSHPNEPKPKEPVSQKQIERELNHWEGWIDMHITASDPGTDVGIESSRMLLSDEVLRVLREKYQDSGWGRLVDGLPCLLTKGCGILYHPDGDKP